MVLIENPVRTSGSAPPRAVGRWATSCRHPRNGITDYWRRSGSFAGGSWAPRMLVTTMPMVNTGAGANCGAEVVWWPGRPDPGCGQCGRVPLGLQPVDAHHPGSLRARPRPDGHRARRRTAGRYRSSRPGWAARPGCRRPAALRSRRPSARLLRRAVSASAAASRRNGSHRPVWRSGSPIGLAVVTVMATADSASNTSGSCSAP